jgi:hypothetical protein
LGKLLETVTRIHLWVRPNLERPMIDLGGFHMTPAPLEVSATVATAETTVPMASIDSALLRIHPVVLILFEGALDLINQSRMVRSRMTIICTKTGPTKALLFSNGRL